MTAPLPPGFTRRAPGDRDPNRGNRRVPLTTFPAADLLGRNDESEPPMTTRTAAEFEQMLARVEAAPAAPEGTVEKVAQALVRFMPPMAPQPRKAMATEAAVAVLQTVKAPADPQAAVQRDALRLIAGAAPHCENFTGPPFCRDESSGRVRGAEFGADRWCDPCVAADALSGGAR